MLARTPQEAVSAFLTPLRRAVACTTTAQLAGGSQPGKQHGLIFRPNEGGYIRLSSIRPIRFRLIHLYRLTESEPGWSVSTVGYTYQLELTDGREIVSYHYDSRPQSKVKTPHLHVRGLDTPLPLGKAHFPTGRISIEAVLRFAIEELDVRPQNSDWENVLRGTEQEFFQKRTWA